MLFDTDILLLGVYHKEIIPKDFATGILIKRKKIEAAYSFTIG